MKTSRRTVLRQSIGFLVGSFGAVHISQASTATALPFEEYAKHDGLGLADLVRRGKVTELEEKPVWPEDLKPMTATEVVDYVVRNVGARPRERDAIDSRIIRGFQERQGRIIDSQEEVGGYPDIEPTRRPLEIPETGMQEWLRELAAELE